jgi:phage terminase large subunit-like protein
MDIYAKFNEQEKADFLALGNEDRGVEKQRIFCQLFFKRDFESFIFLLGHRDLGKFHKKEIARLQEKRFISDDIIRDLWLWSRGHFKTTIITIDHSIWLIVNNPDIRMLLVSNTLDVSKKIFSEIRDQFLKNEEFRYFFREYCPIANKEGKIEWGTTEQFTIPLRSKILKEPTMMVAGIGTNLTTLHFDYMKIDDLVTRDSVTNDEQVQASKEYYGSLRQLFDNPEVPREDVVGTIYHFNDLYYSVLMKMAEFKLSFNPAKDNNGNVIFKERFTEEGLNAILNDPSVGPYTFQTQYMLNPVNPKDAKLKTEWWQEYDKLPESLAEYIFVDPASTQKKKSDYTVIERWGIDYEGKHYLLEGIRDKLTVFQRIDEVTRIAKLAKRLVMVKYEVLGGRHGDLEQLKQKFKEEHMYIEPTETKSTTSSKADRIEQRLVGAWHSGIIFMPKTCSYKSKDDGKVRDFVQEYKLEYLQFPFTQHDDILDCHSQMFEDLQGLQRGKKPVTVKDHKFITADDEQRQFELIKKYRSQGIGVQEAISRIGIKDLIHKTRMRNG